MKKSVLTNKSSSSTIIISMLCLISLIIASCDNMRTSMILDPYVAGEPPEEEPPTPEPPTPEPPEEPPTPEPPEEEPPTPEPPTPEPPEEEPPTPEPPEEEPPTPEPPPSILQVGDRITVRQTAGLGIRIRAVPYGDRIGGMFDGETGMIISGPREVGGLTWVEIEWDAPVKNPQSGCGIGENVCIGWSAVVLENGTQVIHKQ